MFDSNGESERVINVKDIDPQHRHTVIFQLFEHLTAKNSLQLVVDHDPKPLRFQLDAKFGSLCKWTYLEEGPDIWRVQLQNTRRSDVGHV